MMEMTKLDQENVWRIVRKTRQLFLSENASPNCEDDKTLLTYRHIKDIGNSLSGKFKLKASSVAKKKISDKMLLKTAAEMFTYLNFCPPKLLTFIVHLFKTGTPRDMILALAGIQKSLQEASEKRKIIEIFQRVMNTFNLNHYEKVQIITKGKCHSNGTFSNCARKMNISNFEAENHSGGFFCL